MSDKLGDISWRTILKLSIAVAVFYLLFRIRQVLIWFIFAVTISLLFEPAIVFLKKKKIPRALAALLIYVVFFGILGILIYLVAPIFINEIQNFLDNFPQYFNKISPLMRSLGFETFKNVETFLASLQKTFQGISKNVFSAISGFFGGIFTSLFVITLAIFLSLEEKGIERTLILLFPKNYEAKVSEVWERCQKKVSGWFGARLLGCLFVGLASYVALFLFEAKYPFTLSLFAGVFNFVPYIGPLAVGIILFLIVFPVSAIKGILVIITLILIQEVENNVISPLLMKKFVGLPPVLVLLALVVGAELWGFLGAILAMPLFGILFEFLKEFLQKKKDREAILI